MVDVRQTERVGKYTVRKEKAVMLRIFERNSYLPDLASWSRLDF